MSYKKRPFSAFDDRSSSDTPSHAPYAVYGTPLPAFEANARDDGSFVPVWKQEVTDERGRKRLHGAFTGGWSAGYFNTVGSKEGWTPTTFVSSRTKRAKAEQKVEDFMDEEDLAERDEATNLETQGVFAGLGSAGGGENGNRGIFADLFRAEGETMGVKLLQRMGWRPGQGVGPKVRRKANGDEKGEEHLFAPEDSRMVSFVQKVDRKGLGYTGEGSLNADKAEAAENDDMDNESHDDARILPNRPLKFMSKPKKARKSGFGVGVLNDTGSDDEDPYAIGPQIKYNRVIGGDRKKKGGLIVKSTGTNTAKPSFISKKLTQTTRASSGFRKCHDGRLPLDGFVLSLEPLTLADDQYPPPTVPEGWQSKHSAASTDTTITPYQSHAEAAKLSTLDPKARAALLGEQALPGKSVFDFLTPAAREKLASASGNSSLPPALSERAPQDYVPSAQDAARTLWDYVPTLDKSTAEAALARGTSGWMPYAEDLRKRERYRAFLELRAGQTNILPHRPQGWSVEDWAKELREFAQAAEVFKPISGLMAARFTTSTSAPRLASDAPEPSSAEQAPEREEDPAEKAAKLGMFGPLTRTRIPFYPTRLLCKRFGIKPPTNAPAGAESAEGEGLELVSQASIKQMMTAAQWSTSQSKGPSFVSGGVENADQPKSAAFESNVPGVMKAEVNAEVNDALEGEKKAGEAVFKAIFGSDDEDDP